MTLKADTIKNNITKIYFRVPFEIVSLSDKIQYIDQIKYYYSKDLDNIHNKDSDRCLKSFLIYRFKHDIVTKVRHLKENKISSTHSQQFNVYTGHDLDTANYTQYFLKLYIEKMTYMWILISKY